MLIESRCDAIVIHNVYIYIYIYDLSLCYVIVVYLVASCVYLCYLSVSLCVFLLRGLAHHLGLLAADLPPLASVAEHVLLLYRSFVCFVCVCVCYCMLLLYVLCMI